MNDDREPLKNVVLSEADLVAAAREQAIQGKHRRRLLVEQTIAYAVAALHRSIEAQVAEWRARLETMMPDDFKSPPGERSE